MQDSPELYTQRLVDKLKSKGYNSYLHILESPVQYQHLCHIYIEEPNHIRYSGSTVAFRFAPHWDQEIAVTRGAAMAVSERAGEQVAVLHRGLAGGHL